MVKWDATFLQSRVAGRIFLLFVLCALLPISVLILISYRQVTQQLKDDAHQQLRQLAELEAMALYAKLEILDDKMRMIADDIASGASTDRALSSRGSGSRLQALGIVTQGEAVPLAGTLRGIPNLTPAEVQHLSAGHAVLQTFACDLEQTCVRLLRQIDLRNPHRGFLVGEPDPNYLWGAESLSHSSNLCIFTESRVPLFCSEQAHTPLPIQNLTKSSGDLEWDHDNQHYLGGYWRLFLKPGFLAPQWTVLLIESQEEVMSPVLYFRRTFPLTILLALWVVLLLSLIQIRRSLVPLRKLQQGTREIANHNFDTRVEITSRDEFQELAESFNQMATRLGRQFKALQTIDEIDRAMLSSLHSQEIARTVIQRIRDLVPCKHVSLSLVDRANPRRLITSLSAQDPKTAGATESVTVPPEELAEIQGYREGLCLSGPTASRSYLRSLGELGMQSFLILPLLHDDRLLGILSFGNVGSNFEDDENGHYARQVADQLAVALANARLVGELNDFTTGTLTALARAIDAKSTWTAGHSERVTSLALEIAKTMGLPEKELVILYRGGLLHDIGKIGTPPPILDKPARLTDDETRIIREHVVTGARILEPIPGFTELLPIVLQHHEHFDGSGYPSGLAGEAISLHARIFAVADVFDALISERPYRKGMPVNQVIQMVREEAGTHFDPKVVQAFLEVMARRKRIDQEAPPLPERPLPSVDSAGRQTTTIEKSRGAHVGN